jgi:cell cycle protein kinase DBF2
VPVLTHHVHSEHDVLRLRRARPKLRDFDILALIGRGGFGEVYLCRRQDTKQTLVIKKVRKQTLLDKGMVDSIRVERQVRDRVCARVRVLIVRA